MNNSRPASYRAVTGLALVVACLFPFTACSEEGSEPLDADEGSGGTESGSGGAGEASGGAVGSGGEAAECEPFRPLDIGCIANLDIVNESCFTLEELNDPCNGTHLWDVHEGMGGQGGMGGRSGNIEGDGGTEKCPSAEDLFWGDEGERCGCFDIPACTTPTRQTGNSCCYLAQRSCRLC